LGNDSGVLKRPIAKHAAKHPAVILRGRVGRPSDVARRWFNVRRRETEPRVPFRGILFHLLILLFVS
jgi:hypothetical protein